MASLWCVIVINSWHISTCSARSIMVAGVLNRLCLSASIGGGIRTYISLAIFSVQPAGNLWKKGPFGQETEYSYNSATHKHAVTHLDEVQKYWYDTVFANGKPGNMTPRV